MKSIQTYLLIIGTTLQITLIVSCETQTEPDKQETETIAKSIHLNFHDNVLELNPLKTTNRAEVFIAEMVFDKFFREDGTSSLFHNYSFDSVARVHFFEIQPNKQFHDGSLIDTYSIQDFFKYLITNHFDQEPVNSFFSSMEGFGLVSWYRENRGILDSIPGGFQIISDTKFSISLRKNDELLRNWLASPSFTLFKQHDSSYVGSGDYKLKNLNEDISAQLVKSPQSSSKIETINISYTKNDELVYSEFFRGSLDLILYNPYSSLESSHTSRLNKILNSKYPQYQVSQRKRSILKYLEINQVQDTSLLQNILASIKENIYLETPVDTAISFHSDSLEKTFTPIRHKVFWYSEIPNDKGEYFTNNESIEFINSTLKNINQTDPHIVIKETVVNFFDSNDKKSATLLLSKVLQNTKNSTFQVLDAFPEYVIYNNSLKGINGNETLSKMIKSAYYENAKTY